MDFAGLQGMFAKKKASPEESLFGYSHQAISDIQLIIDSALSSPESSQYSSIHLKKREK